MSESSKPFCPPDTPLRWVRPRQVDIPHIDLEITVDIAAQQVIGAVTHHCQPLPHGPAVLTLELDQHGLEIASVEVAGEPAMFSTSPGKLAIAMPAGWKNLTPVRVTFTARSPALGMFFIQPRSADGKSTGAGARVPMAWTQGAMEDHSHWFPCFDSPNQMSTFTVAIRHRSELVGIANGDRTGCTVHGDGWTTTTFTQRVPQVLYLLNVVVGDLVAVEDSNGPVPIADWLPRGQEACAPAMFRATAFGIRWLSDMTGVPFAWSRYGHAVAHGFMWGGMENATLTTITDRVVMDAETQIREDVDCDSLVIHELVHQWYGDLLTMKGWSDIWLNESFATYLEARGTAAWEASRGVGREAEQVDLHLWRNREAYLEEDGARYRRALVTNRWVDAYELFDRVAYEKGSLVLHHLCHVLGEDRFRAALKLYTERHARDLVETADFRQALEDVTGEPLDWFFSQWVDRPGHPELKVRWRHDPSRGQVIIDIEQTQAANKPDQRYRLPMAVAWREQPQAARGSAEGAMRGRAAPVQTRTWPGGAEPSGAAGTPQNGDVLWEEDGVLVRHDIDVDKQADTLVFTAKNPPLWLALDPDGHVPAVWDEDGDATQLLARIADDGLSAQARARAVTTAAKLHPTPQLISGLASISVRADHAELVRHEAISALGELRGSHARDALVTMWAQLREPRLRRAVARALGRFRGDALVAERLVAFADGESSRLTTGECLAARAALEIAGATPLLRSRMNAPSWQQRLRQHCVRGLGDSGEAAAIDEVLPIATAVDEHEGVRAAACTAAGKLGARQVLARDRVRRVLERLLDDEEMPVRGAAAKALATLGDAKAASAISARLAREPFGNLRRVLRETNEALGKAAAITTATAELTKRIETLEDERKRLERRLEALEKRFDSKGA